jgi:hypothetical protein
MTKGIKRILRSGSTVRLSLLCMDTLTALRNNPDSTTLRLDLELIVEAMKGRPFNERLAAYGKMMGDLNVAIRESNYGGVESLKSMIEYYRLHIL